MFWAGEPYGAARTTVGAVVQRVRGRIEGGDRDAHVAGKRMLTYADVC